MNPSQEVNFNNRAYIVDPDGNISTQLRLSNCIEADEVRLAVCKDFLLDRRLSKAQHKYWSSIQRMQEKAA